MEYVGGFTKHGRRARRYAEGETLPNYGIARQLEDGTYQFKTAHGTWSKDYACRWTCPPHHYLTPKTIDEGGFLVNFNKPNSPKPKAFTGT